MANNASAIKRHKQSEVRRIHNKSVKSAARTCAKKYTLAVIEKNAAARKKSRMQKLYNVTFSQK